MKHLGFKEGDRVYIIPLGWGNITGVREWDIEIKFDNIDGYKYVSGDVKSLLSFTEYTLEGFSQERPEPSPKIGDVVWVRDVDTEPWFVSHFISKEDEWYHTSSNMNGKKYLRWRQLKTTNPYADEQ